MENAGQETAPEGVFPSVRLYPAGNQGHKGRNVLVFGTQPVGYPRTHARPARDGAPGVEQQFRRGVVELVGRHRLDKGQIVREFGQVGDGVREPLPGLPMLLELVRGAHQFRLAAGKGEALAFEELVRAFLVVKFLEFRLVVEQIEVRGGTGHVQVDDPLGRGREMGFPWLLRACGVEIDITL